MTLLSSSLLLVFILVACGGGGTTTTTTSTPTPTVKPSPTPSPTPAVSFTTYTGKGFTISYPQGWKVTTSNNDQEINMTNDTAMASLAIVVVPDPNGIASASTFLNTEVNAVQKSVTNAHTVNIPANTTIGGDTWVQKSLVGTSTSQGQSGVVQFVFACDIHPASTSESKSFTILYGTPQALFNTANTTYFQPMLQSFKFTS